MAFSITERLSSPTGLLVAKGGLTASVGIITTAYGSLGAVSTDLDDYSFAEVGITANDNRYYRNTAANAWILYFSSSNFSIGNLSPIFTAAINNPTTAPAIAFTLTSAAAGTVLNNNAGAAAGPIYTANIALGENGVTGGSIQFRSSTAGGAVIMQLAGSSGNYNFNLPLSAGTAGQVLTSQGGGSNAMTWTTISSGGFVTADNGLTASTATNVQLGGTLLHDTTIAGGNFTLQLTSTGAIVQTLYVSASGAGAAAIVANSSSGTIVAQTSGNFTCLSATTLGNGKAAVLTSQYTSTNTIETVLDVLRFTSGAATAGIGVAMDMWVEMADGAGWNTHRLISRVTNVGAGGRSAEFVINGLNGNALADRLTLKSTGQLQLNQYGVGTFTGTVAFALGVDGSGNVIEFPGSGGGGSAAGTYTPTLANAANVTSSTAFDCQYSAVTDPNSGTTVVTVSGKFSLTFTTGGSVTRLGISLPIVSDIINDQEVGGVAGSNSLTNGSFAVRGDTTNNRAEFYATAPGTGTTETYWFTFTYLVNIP